MAYYLMIRDITRIFGEGDNMASVQSEYDVEIKFIEKLESIGFIIVSK